MFDDTENMDLSVLSNEILLLIMRNLPPLSLSAFGRTSERFFALSCDRMVLKNINFSKYSSLSLRRLNDFFIPARSSFISELNFDDCKWIGSPLLENCIIKCTQLHTLSVRNCDFTLTDMFRIVRKLKHLKNLTWNVTIDRTFERGKYLEIAPTEVLNNLKKVVFEFWGDHQIKNFFILWDEFLPSCNSLQELEVNLLCKYSGSYWSVDESIYEFVGNHRNFHLNSLDSLTVTWDKALIFRHEVGAIKSIVTFLYNAKVPGKKWKKLWISHMKDYYDINFVFVNENDVEDFNGVKCLQLNCEKIDVLAKILENVPTCSVHSLGISHSQLELLESKKIIGACEKNLRHFVSNCSQELHGIPRVPVTLLENLFTSCCNITVLNIQGIHFDMSDCPCTAICNLKSLQRLCLPSCAVPKVLSECQIYEPKKKLKISNPIRNMVENCRFVKELHLVECPHGLSADERANPDYCLSDYDIDDIYLWEKLEYLHLSKFGNLSSCEFFQRIALNCKSFQTLILISNCFLSKCLNVSGLCFLLRNAKCLSSLKIEILFAHSTINLDNFWDSLSYAKNLERFCFCVCPYDKWNPIVIRNSITELSNKRLRTFHLFFRIKDGVYRAMDSIMRDFKLCAQSDADFKSDCDFEVHQSSEHKCYFTNVTCFRIP